MDFDDDTPYNVLTRHPDAIPGWVNDLRTYCRGSAGETVSNTQMSLQLVLKPLADPSVLAVVCPPAEDGQGRLFDSAAFLESTDALYLLSEGGSSGAAPLLTALLGDVIRVARTKSQRTAAARLDPPLLFSLDEFVNIAPVPDAPSLASDGGGRGLATRFYYQDYSQIEKRYGREGAQTIWTASSAKMLMGGSANDAQLESISRLLGDRDVTRTSRTFTESDDLPNYSVTQQRERKFTTSDLREIPEGKALLMYRDQPGAIVDLIPWWQRRDAEQLRKGQQWVLEREGLGSEHA